MVSQNPNFIYVYYEKHVSYLKKFVDFKRFKGFNEF